VDVSELRRREQRLPVHMLGLRDRAGSDRVPGRPEREGCRDAGLAGRTRRYHAGTDDRGRAARLPGRPGRARIRDVLGGRRRARVRSVRAVGRCPRRGNRGGAFPADGRAAARRRGGPRAPRVSTRLRRQLRSDVALAGRRPGGGGHRGRCAARVPHRR